MVIPVIAVGFKSMRSGNIKKLLFLFSIFSQLFVYVVIAFYERTAIIDIMAWVRERPDSVNSILFLANPHIGPFYSYVHRFKNFYYKY